MREITENLHRRASRGAVEEVAEALGVAGAVSGTGAIARVRRGTRLSGPPGHIMPCGPYGA